MHGFESFEKQRMFNNSKEHNRNIAKSDWKKLIVMMGYKSRIKTLNPYNSTKRCSRCGMVNAPKGAINLYLQMEGLSPSPRLFDELINAWRGFTLTGALTGEEADEGPDELVRAPKADESQELCNVY